MARRSFPAVASYGAIRRRAVNGRTEVHALASGSSGNAMLVQADGVNLLIDAGMPIRALIAALRSRGVVATDLHAILLTHEHTDHVSAVSALIRRTHAPLVASGGTLTGLAEREQIDGETRILRPGEELGFGCIGVRAFPVPHDALEPTGFVIETSTAKIAYCTDVGCVTAEIQAALNGVHLAVIEANHDLDMLWHGPYTQSMKERVASSTGHLCNDACADLIAQRLEEQGPLTVWLAHLSRVNNAPSLAKRSILAQIVRQTRVPVVLDVALRDQPSVRWMSGASAVQLTLLD